MTWTMNHSPVFLWRNEKQSRNLKGFSLRDHTNPVLGYARTAKDARRALDANLRKDAIRWDSTPGSSASRAAVADGSVDYAQFFDFGDEVSDVSVLDSMDEISAFSILSAKD